MVLAAACVSSINDLANGLEAFTSRPTRRPVDQLGAVRVAFPTASAEIVALPVTLPPGRARLVDETGPNRIPGWPT